VSFLLLSHRPATRGSIGPEGRRVSRTDESIDRRTGLTDKPRHTRRLSDKILIAFHQSCDQGDLDVAEELLWVLSLVMTRRPLAPRRVRRRNRESLVAAYERLWNLRHQFTFEYLEGGASLFCHSP
jgi:hypothetical protein